MEHLASYPFQLINELTTILLRFAVCPNNTIHLNIHTRLANSADGFNEV